MASAGTKTVDTTGELLYQDTALGGCRSFLVSVPLTSTSDALINISGLHESGEFLPIVKGKEYIFTHGKVGIKSVFAKGNGGNATVNYGIVEK